ncbi:MAG TPA: hypothetical protein VGN00_17850 [Puia sp.]|jgi:hypothetical protein
MKKNKVLLLASAAVLTIGTVFGAKEYKKSLTTRWHFVGAACTSITCETVTSGTPCAANQLYTENSCTNKETVTLYKPVSE